METEIQTTPLPPPFLPPHLQSPHERRGPRPTLVPAGMSGNVRELIYEHQRTGIYRRGANESGGVLVESVQRLGPHKAGRKIRRFRPPVWMVRRQGLYRFKGMYFRASSTQRQGPLRAICGRQATVGQSTVKTKAHSKVSEHCGAVPNTGQDAPLNANQKRNHQNGGASAVRHREGIATTVRTHGERSIGHHPGCPAGASGNQADGLLTVPELAKRLQFSTRKVREYARTGKFPVVRLNSRDLRFHWPTVIQRLAGA